MTQDEIIKMLRAACDKDKVDPEQNGFWVIHTDELEAFAKLVAEHEREACAKIVEANADACSTDSLAQMYLYSNANAIRARGQA